MIRTSTGVHRRLYFRFSTFASYSELDPSSANPTVPKPHVSRNKNTIPIPHRTNPEPKGQDLDFVNVAHSHLIQSDWDKLHNLSHHLNPFRVKNILLKIHKDHVLSLEFFTWVKRHTPSSHSLETSAVVLHALTKNRKFKSAESILRELILSTDNNDVDLLFETLLYSYRECDSSPRVFDSLFKAFAHLKKFRNATDTFMQMKEYGFFPNVESCNAYMSSLLGHGRVDIALRFYREMRRCKISPNTYTLNMVISCYCKSGKLDKGVELLQDMERLGFKATNVSYNTLIAGYCEKGLLSSALKLKNAMMGKKNGLQPDVVTFNTLIHGFCKEAKLKEASKVFGEMKAVNVEPNTVTYNTLINGYGQQGDHEMAYRFYEDMVFKGIKRDVLTYNGLILGLCKQAKTKKAAHFVKELDKEDLVPNSSTFSALIMGQCVRRNADRGFELYRSMIRSGCHPNEETFNVLISAFCKNEDFDGAAQVLREMVRRSVPLDSRTVHQVCNGLEHQGKDQLAKELLQELEAIKSLQEPFR